MVDKDKMLLYNLQRRAKMDMEIVKKWDIGNILSIDKVNTTNLVYKIFSDMDKYILKMRDKFEEINFEFSKKIKEMFPIEYPIIAKDGMPYVFYEDKYYVLYKFFDGEPLEIQFDKNYLEQAKLLGESVSNYHYCLKNIEIDSIQEFKLTDDVIKSYDYLLENKFEFNGSIVSNIMEKYKKYFVPVYSNLPKLLIHRDLHPGNIIFNNNKLVGIIDLDHCVKGVRLFDICYCATAILSGESLEDKITTDKWLEIFKIMLTEYDKKNNITKEEKSNIKYILVSIQIIFMSYYCGINKPNEIKKNEEMLIWLYNNK
jgi:Ser/Thr protein kinase RdoA (MazF antagonist)